MAVVNAKGLGGLRHPESVAKLQQGHGRSRCTRAGSRCLWSVCTLAAQRVARRLQRGEADKARLRTFLRVQLSSRTRSSQSAS
jgi:hypothetical protein